MQISRAGEYGVLGLLQLARQPVGQPVMIDAVSRDAGIPKSFLAKIFQDLAKAGLLRSQRGAGGGFVLARPAPQISILEIIEAIDGRIALQRCLGDAPDCDKRIDCALCGLLETAQDRLKDVFGQTSLQDLVHQQESRDRRKQARNTPVDHLPDDPTPCGNGAGCGCRQGQENGHAKGGTDAQAASRPILFRSPSGHSQTT